MFLSPCTNRQKNPSSVPPPRILNNNTRTPRLGASLAEGPPPAHPPHQIPRPANPHAISGSIEHGPPPVASWRPSLAGDCVPSRGPLACAAQARLKEGGMGTRGQTRARKEPLARLRSLTHFLPPAAARHRPPRLLNPPFFARLLHRRPPPKGPSVSVYCMWKTARRPFLAPVCDIDFSFPGPFRTVPPSPSAPLRPLGPASPSKEQVASQTREETLE
ncbi:hypothetical protein B0T11DRAFT_90748 [Plectosphaerella cucumerina]|uniref:Uncharacterized protein n=1 Tax=Plectosphaerella cucumerina TaxID=40658 RepID=A0A8K0TG93_9PEZI|nr:hypothetical protein B0T11DRAFT_90748 [Plectosphaerella cucumerina]